MQKDLRQNSKHVSLKVKDGIHHSRNVHGHKIILLTQLVVKKVIFNILIAQDMSLYFCRNSLTGNDSIYDARNVEGFKMNFQAHFTEIKG